MFHYGYEAAGFSETLVGLFTCETASCNFPEDVIFIFLAVTNFCLILPLFPGITKYTALSFPFY
jgi:hypothetical protein